MTDQHTGWTCPRCGAVNAPWVPRCSCQHGTTFIPAPATIPDPYVRSPYRQPLTRDPMLSRPINWS